MKNLTYYLLISVLSTTFVAAQENIALKAKASTFYVSSWESLDAINDGYEPEHSGDKSHTVYGNWGGVTGGAWSWVQYDFDEYYQVTESQVYWFTDDGGVLVPDSCNIQFWDALTSKWLPVQNAKGNGVARDKYNITTFSPTLTNKVRLNFMGKNAATGISEWRVYGKLSEQVAVYSNVTIDKPLALNTASAITATALDKDGKPVKGYVFKLAINKKNRLTTTDEVYLANKSQVNGAGTVIEFDSTDVQGKSVLNIVIPQLIDPADGIAVQVLFNEGSTVIGQPFSIFAQGNIPPVLTADITDNNIDYNIEITYTDEVSWRTGIYAVLAGKDTLKLNTDYEIEAGKIILKPTGLNSNLTKSGTKKITILSAGYEDISFLQPILAGAADAGKSYLKQILKFYLNSSAIIEAVALDKYDNPVSGYLFKWKSDFINTTATTSEVYKIAGENISANFTDGELLSTNEKGYVRFRIIIPVTVDVSDGLSFQLLQNNGSGNIGAPLSFRNDGGKRPLAYIHEIKSQPDYSFENGTAQSDHFIIFWGEKAGTDPTITAVNNAAKFDPQNVLKVLESVFDCYAKDIEFLDTTAGSPSKYKFVIEISNTWRDANINGWAYGGSTTTNKGEALGWMQLAADATKGGNGLAHEFAHAVQSTGCKTPVGGNMHEVDANFASIQYSNNNIGSVDMGRFILTQHFPWLTGRHYYVCWYFMQHLVDKYGKDFISRCYNKGNGGDLIDNYKYILGKTQTDVCDEFTLCAMKNVTWDYSNGTYIRDFYHKLYNNRTVGRDFTILDSVRANKNMYIVPFEMAPGDYGYNKIRLYPNSPTAKVEVNLFAYSSNEESGWRYGFVAVRDSAGIPIARYSQIYTYPSTKVEFSLNANEQEMYLVVCATPSKHHGTPGDNGFTKNYRYPYGLVITGALPAGFKDGYNSQKNIYRNGVEHVNGGGWVASTAKVDASVYVGPNAQVVGNAVVTGNVRIEDFAIVEGDAKVSGDAIIRGNAIVGKDAQVYDNAIVEKTACVFSKSVIHGNAIITGSAFLVKSDIAGNAVIRENAFLWGATGLAGTIIVGGDVEAFSSCTKGTYMQYGRSTCDKKDWAPGNDDINPTVDEYYYPTGEFPTKSDYFEVSNITSSSALVKWDASRDFGTVKEYWIFGGSVLLKKATGTSDTLKGLKADTKYKLFVRAKDDVANFSPKSNVVEITTLPTIINNLDESVGFKMFPNPVESKLTIECDNTEKVIVSIFDNIGRKVASKVFENKTTIDKNEIGLPGIYYLQLNTASRNVIEKVIIE